jgi:hypothetical protein
MSAEVVTELNQPLTALETNINKSIHRRVSFIIGDIDFAH